MSVKLHTLRMKVAAVLPGGGEIGMWCVFLEVQCVVGLRDADFILNYTVGRKKTETGHFPSCFAALQGSSGFVSAGGLPITWNSEAEEKKVNAGLCCDQVNHHWCQMSHTSSKIIRLTLNDSDSCFIDNGPAPMCLFVFCYQTVCFCRADSWFLNELCYDTHQKETCFCNECCSRPTVHALFEM